MDKMGIAVMNRGRQFEIDCVKFFAIFFMISVHVYEELGGYDWSEMPADLFRNGIEFVGGPLAAPAFMFSMGIGMVYSRKNSAKELMKRGIKLLLTGYIFNFFRETILLILGNLAGLDYSFEYIVASVFTVDILQFAGMAFLAIGFMKAVNISTRYMLIVAILLQALGMLGLHLSVSNVILSDFISMILPIKDGVVFPMTLWLIYPVMGIMFAEILQKVADKKTFYLRILIISIALFVGITAALMYIDYDIRLMYALYDNSYYCQSFLHVLWTLPIILTSIALNYFIFSGIEKSRFAKFVTFCSSKLNTIYIIQWLLIAYTLAFGITISVKNGLVAWEIIVASLIIMLLSVTLAKIIKKPEHHTRVK